LLLATAGPALACDLCAIYRAADARGEYSTGWTVTVAEQFTRLSTEQFNGTEFHRAKKDWLDRSMTHVVAGWNFAEHFGISANLPLVHLRYRFSELRDGVNPAVRDGSDFGLGDLALVGRWQILERSDMEWGATVNLLGGVKLPTGASGRLEELEQSIDRYEVIVGPGHQHDALGNIISGIHVHDITLGSGSVDGIVGIAGTLDLFDHVQHAGGCATVQWATHGADGAGNCGSDVCAGRGDHAASERGGIHAVLGSGDEVGVDGLNVRLQAEVNPATRAACDADGWVRNRGATLPTAHEVRLSIPPEGVPSTDRPSCLSVGTTVRHKVSGRRGSITTIDADGVGVALEGSEIRVPVGQFAHWHWVRELSPRVGDPVVCTTNDRVGQTPPDGIRLTNGVRGVVTGLGPGGHMEVTWEAPQGALARTHTPEDQARIKLAYASTVHRGQGQQARVAILALHPAEHYALLDNTMLFVGLSRATEMGIIVGSPQAISRCVQNRAAETRHTRLDERVQAAVIAGPTAAIRHLRDILPASAVLGPHAAAPPPPPWVTQRPMPGTRQGRANGRPVAGRRR
jgi:hypothetical protein